jgi:formylmethanofuran dehydrogenase subunit E
MKLSLVAKPQQLSLLLIALQLTLGAPATAHPVTSSATDSTAAAIQRVTEIHGGAGPWAVVGYRMGMRALQELGLMSPTPHTSRNRFLVEVIHESPAEIPFVCIVDGLHAATGASLGKLNLKLVEVESLEKMRSVVIHRETGKRVEFQVLPEFIAKYQNLPPEQLAAAGQEVLQLADEKLFRLAISP